MIGQLACSDIRTAEAHPAATGASHSHAALNTAATVGGKAPGRSTVRQVGATVTADPSIFVTNAAALVLEVKAALGTACAGAETVTVDVRNSITSVLTGVISFAAADPAGTVKTGVVDLAHDDLAPGNQLIAIITQTPGLADAAADLEVEVAWRIV
jgi:hypothetical protein